MNDANGYDELKIYLGENGFNCSYYRDPYIQRRINLRLSKAKTRDYSAYLSFLKKTPAEFQHLVDCLAVNVTSFFRDHTPFQKLGDQVLPEIISEKAKTGGKTIQIWSAACSTGEEPYSIAMVIKETMAAKLADNFRVRILATDIDQQALEFAGKGLYPEGSVEVMDDKLLRRYFKPRDHAYAVRESLRELVEFKKLDLIADDPIGTYDLIFCRNMLIYINMEYQADIFKKFHGALNPGGFLILGGTELIPQECAGLFRAFDSPARIYRKN